MRYGLRGLALLLLAGTFACGSDSMVSPPASPVVTLVSGDAQQVPFGQTAPQPLVVSVTTQAGDPVPGVVVNWGVVSGGGTLSSSSSTTDQAGKASVTWTLGPSGTQTVKAWTNLPGTQSVTFSAQPPPPTPPPVVTLVSGDAQQVPFGQTEPQPLVVSVTTLTGVPVPGVLVNWGVVSGGGTLSSSSSTTDQAGKASVTWTLGQSGTQTVKAWTNLPGTQSVTFSAQPRPLPLALTKVSGDAQEGAFSATLPAPLVVTITTASGAPVPNVKVNWGIVTGGGSLSAISSLTDQAGRASVSWILGPEPYVNQLVKAWTDIDASQNALFSAIGEATLVIHFDGTAWSRSLLTTQYNIDLNTGWASPSIAFAAGTHCPNPFVIRFTGGVWSGMNTCAGYALTVTSMWGTSSNDVWAVASGNGGTRLSPVPLAWVYHFDGSGWTVSYTDGDATHAPDLLAVGARSADDVIAVGKRGRIVRHAGTQWFDQSSGTTNALFAVWGDPNSASVFAVGDAGTITHFDGAAWHVEPSGTAAQLNSVWGSSANDVFAVGTSGTILHYDGVSWSQQSSGTTQNLRGVWGSSANSVFAVGDGATILRYDGARWTPQSTGIPMTSFTSVWGTSASDVFVTGH